MQPRHHQAAPYANGEIIQRMSTGSAAQVALMKTPEPASPQRRTVYVPASQCVVHDLEGTSVIRCYESLHPRSSGDRSPCAKRGHRTCLVPQWMTDVLAVPVRVRRRDAMVPCQERWMALPSSPFGLILVGISKVLSISSSSLIGNSQHHLPDAQRHHI